MVENRFAEYREYIPSVLLLSYGVNLASSGTLESQFVGIIVALVGTLSFLLTSMSAAIGRIMTVILVYALLKTSRANHTKGAES